MMKRSLSPMPVSVVITSFGPEIRTNKLAVIGVPTGCVMTVAVFRPVPAARYGKTDAVGVTALKLPPQSPNLNAYPERLVRSIKGSCLDRLILFGEDSLRTALRQFTALSQRVPPSGLGNRLILPEPSDADKRGSIKCCERLG